MTARTESTTRSNTLKQSFAQTVTPIALCSSSENDEIGRESSDASASLKSLQRLVFDDLFDRDLLGFLLSSNHFAHHLRNMVGRSDRFSARQLGRISNDALLTKEFHLGMLEMYSGAHIKECKHTSAEALMRDLDQQFEQSASDESGEVECLLAHPGTEEANRVETAWQYRMVCAAGTMFLGGKS